MARTSISDDQILNAAMNVIIERGYAGAATREIAAVAGINEVTLFRRFGSKENLLRAVVAREAQSFVSAAVAYSGDVETDLLRIVQFYYDLMQVQGRVIATLLAELPRQPELLEIVQIPLSIFAQISALIQRYQNEGVLLPEPPILAFVALVGPLLLRGVLGTIQPEVFDIPVEPAELVQRYLQGRAAR